MTNANIPYRDGYTIGQVKDLNSKILKLLLLYTKQLTGWIFAEEKTGGVDMSDILEPIEYQTGTAIQTFNIIETSVSEDGYEVLLNIDLDSGYELEGVRMKISFEDLAAYETNDIQEGVKYALGFFHE